MCTKPQCPPPPPPSCPPLPLLQVDKLLAVKGKSFEEAVIRRVSVAAAPMAQWVTANLEFSRVLQKVAPLEAELNRLVASLAESTNLIKQYEEELVALEGQVGGWGGVRVGLEQGRAGETAPWSGGTF